MGLHKRLRLKEWREGVNINRAAELLCPDAVALYHREAFKNGPSKKASTAYREIMETIEGILHAGELVLEILYPPDDPQGSYVEVSMDVLNTKGLSAFWKGNLV